MPLNRLQQEHPFFRKFSIEAVSCILQLGRVILLQPNQILYRQEDMKLNFYLIVYGWLELVHKTPDQNSSDQQLLIIEDNQKYRTKRYQQRGLYGIGTFIGEEWIFCNSYICREETCISRDNSAVLELSVQQFEMIRMILLESKHSKDLSILES